MARSPASAKLAGTALKTSACSTTRHGGELAPSAGVRAMRRSVVTQSRWTPSSDSARTTSSAWVTEPPTADEYPPSERA